MALSPRLAVSTVLRGVTFVASFGKFQQAPDYQYLVDAAFDDTLRTGRSRTGNPDLGFENSTQYEFSVRARPTPSTSTRTPSSSRNAETSAMACSHAAAVASASAAPATRPCRSQFGAPSVDKSRYRARPSFAGVDEK